MIRKQTVSLILAAVLAMTLLVGQTVGWMNAGLTSAGAIPAEVVSNPSGILYHRKLSGQDDV